MYTHMYTCVYIKICIYIYILISVTSHFLIYYMFFPEIRQPASIWPSVLFRGAAVRHVFWNGCCRVDLILSCDLGVVWCGAEHGIFLTWEFSRPIYSWTWFSETWNFLTWEFLLVGGMGWLFMVIMDHSLIPY